MKKLLLLPLLLVIIVTLSHCTAFEKAKRVDSLEQEVNSLRLQLTQQKETTEAEIKRLIEQKDKEANKLIDEKDKEINRLVAENTKQSELLIVENDKYAKLKEEFTAYRTKSEDELAQKNIDMQRRLAEKTAQITSFQELKEEEISTLEKAQADLAKSLKQELKQYKAKLEMTERGLVLTFLAEIFFDSGKDIIRRDAKPTLKKVATVLNEKVPESLLAIEGHTDNVPIRYSGWQSNWELSVARALAVVHYFVDEADVKPTRLSAVGYGKYRPIASNDTPTGMQQNRRVEIIILPTKLQKIKTST